MMASRRPRVSVVMPVHNGGPYLEEALESILRQSFEDFQLIAVDDHSTDESPARLRRAADEDRRVRMINSPGHGFVAAIMAGVAASEAEWIARMDADDRAHPDRLARQMAYLDSHGDLDVLGTSVQVVEPNGRPVNIIRYPLHHALIILSLRAATTFAHGTVIMRRAVLAGAGGYRLERFPVEDYDLWCRLAIGGARMANLDEVLYDYRLSPAGVSRTATETQRDMSRQVGVEYGRAVPTIPGAREAWRAVAAIANQVADGEVDVRALARAARSTREAITPWMSSRRWEGARAALAACLRAEAAYRKNQSLRAAGRRR